MDSCWHGGPALAAGVYMYRARAILRVCVRVCVCVYVCAYVRTNIRLRVLKNLMMPLPSRSHRHPCLPLVRTPCRSGPWMTTRKNAPTYLHWLRALARTGSLVHARVGLRYVSSCNPVYVCMYMYIDISLCVCVCVCVRASLCNCWNDRSMR